MEAFNDEIKRLGTATESKLSLMYMVAGQPHILKGFVDVSDSYAVEWTLEGPSVLKERVLGAMYRMRDELSDNIDALEDGSLY